MKKYQNTTSLLRLLNECYPLNWHEIININRHNIFLRPIITFSPTWLANKYSYDSTNIFFKYCSEINLTLTALSHHICYVVNNASCQISYRNININREPHSVSELVNISRLKWYSYHFYLHILSNLYIIDALHSILYLHRFMFWTVMFYYIWIILRIMYTVESVTMNVITIFNQIPKFKWKNPYICNLWPLYYKRFMHTWTKSKFYLTL